MKTLGLLIGLSLGLVACSNVDESHRLTIAKGHPEGWASHTPIGLSLLVERGRVPHRLALALRQDGRVDSTIVRFELDVRNTKGRLYRDTLQLKWADKPGHWRSPRVAIHELDTIYPKPLTFPYAGLYHIELRPLRDTPLRGVVSIGFALNPISPHKQTADTSQ